MIFLLVGFVISSLVSASLPQQVETSANNVETQVQKVDNFLTSSDYRSNYLKQRWASIINQTAFGKVLFSINTSLITASPVFKIILGIPYNFSWIFFLTLISWFFFVRFFWRISYAVSVYLLSLIGALFSSIARGTQNLFDNVLLFRVFNYFLLGIIILFFSGLKLPLLISKVVVGFFGDADFFMKLFYLVCLVLFYFIWKMIYRPLSRLSGAIIKDIKQKRARRAEIREEIKRSSNSEKKSRKEETERFNGLSDNQNYASIYLEELGKALRESDQD
jgi:hypothetical protein